MKSSKIGVAAVFKNECPFIVEWLAYHRVIGVSQFFIADNESNDGTTDLLLALSDLGYLKYLTYKTEKDTPPQLAAYQLLAKSFKDEVDWMCYIDADEFLRLSAEKGRLSDVLSTALSNPRVGAIAVNWAIYGSSNWITANSDPVITRFTRRASRDRRENQHYKTIVRTEAYEDVGHNPHMFTINDKYIYADPAGCELTVDDLDGLTRSKITWDPLRINHYVVKSRCEFFTKKRPRGRPNGQLRPAEFFSHHDMNDEHEEFSSDFIETVEREKSEILRRLEERHGNKFSRGEPSGEALFFSTNAENLKICIDVVRVSDGALECQGWVVGDDCEFADFKALVDYSKMFRASRIERKIRPDVAKEFGIDPTVRYGFICTFDFNVSESHVFGEPVVELCVGSGRENAGKIVPVVIKK